MLTRNGKIIPSPNLIVPKTKRQLMTMSKRDLQNLMVDLHLKLPKSIKISEIRNRLLMHLLLSEIADPKSKLENLQEKGIDEQSPPNMLTSDELKSRARSSLDGESSRSASLSKFVQFVNWHNDLSREKYEGQSDLQCPMEVDKFLEPSVDGESLDFHNRPSNTKN